MRPILRAGLFVVIAAGCGAPRPVVSSASASEPSSEASGATEDSGAPLWSALGRARSGPDAPHVDCLAAFGTYGWGFGLRGLACDAVTPLGPLAAAAGVPVFLDGPHAPGPEGLGLNLASRHFGHYNPAFVRWAVEAVTRGEDRPAVRAATQPLYDASLRRLARVYWLSYAGLATDGFPRTTPVGPEKDYVVYLRGGPTGVGGDEVYPGFTMTAFNERSRSIPEALGIGADDLEWFEAQYEANTAVGFWLRRREDGTLDAFRDGLRRLLAVYDAPWLGEQG